MFITQSIGEFSLEGLEAESELFVDSELADVTGEMRSSEGKTYTVTQKNTTESDKTLQTFIKESGPKNGGKGPDLSPMHLATLTYQQNSTPRTTLEQQNQPKEKGKPSSPSPNPVKEKSAPKTSPQVASEPLGRSKKTETRQSNTTAPEKAKEGRPFSLESRSWSKEETNQWWEERYHQKERDGERDQPPEEHVEGVYATSNRPKKPTYQRERAVQKPLLERPRTGIFALYYILTKIGIFSDGTSNFSYKKEIEALSEESTSAHKKRLEELKIAIDKESSASRWGVAAQVFSWIGSLVGIITGIAMIATGVGAITGALLIAGGVIQLTNQILEISGGWKKIAELLPGNDAEKKRAVISWMQIGIAVLCLILSGVGIIWGGYSQLGDASQAAMSALAGIAAMGHGVTTIGEGVTLFMFKDKMSEVKRYDKILAGLKHKRQDLMERVDGGIDRLEQLFEDLAKTLEFEVELFRADQMVNR